MTYDGQTFRKGDAVVCGCTLHADQRGKIERFSDEITGAYVRFSDGGLSCVPLHMLDHT